MSTRCHNEEIALLKNDNLAAFSAKRGKKTMQILCPRKHNLGYACVSVLPDVAVREEAEVQVRQSVFSVSAQVSWVQHR